VCEAGNQPPIAVDDAVVTTTTPVVLDVLANDSDPDPGDTLRIIGVTQPEMGTVQINAVGPGQDTLTYVADGGPGRVDTFRYSVSDGRGGSTLATVSVELVVLFCDGFESADESVWSETVGQSCDPDGTYTLVTPSVVQYSCCTIFGPPEVDIDITEFEFAQDGTEITPSVMHYPATLRSDGATCPSGSFENFDVLSGGCTETYTLEGAFIDADTWSGTLEMNFFGADCDCLGADPCADQVFPVTATRP
jgi:hypothetical protein